jgi:hypothetical protein
MSRLAYRLVGDRRFRHWLLDRVLIDVLISGQRMVQLRSQTGFRLRAALATFLLLFGAIASTARLWLPEPVTCGMACCEASGVCYCKAHTGESTATGAAAHTDAHADNLNATSISRSCPALCAQLPAGFQRHSIARAHPPRFAPVARVARGSFVHTPYLVRDTLTAEAHAPRAPPACDGLIA